MHPRSDAVDEVTFVRERRRRQKMFRSRMLAVEQAGNKRYPGTLGPVKNAPTRYDIGGRIRGERSRDLGEMFGMPNVVVSEICDIRSTRAFDAQIVGRTLAAAMRRQFVGGDLRGADRSYGVKRAVATAVRDDDDFVIPERLTQRGKDRRPDVRSAIVRLSLIHISEPTR